MPKKIRLGILGGGGDSLIGVLHRVASFINDNYEIVGAVFNPDFEENIGFAKKIDVPTNRIYKDFDTFPGLYYSLGIGHSIPVGDMSLDLSAAIGYYDVDYYDYSEFHDGSISASMTFDINDFISLRSLRTPRL